MAENLAGVFLACKRFVSFILLDNDNSLELSSLKQ